MIATETTENAPRPRPAPLPLGSPLRSAILRYLETLPPGEARTGEQIYASLRPDRPDTTPTDCQAALLGLAQDEQILWDRRAHGIVVFWASQHAAAVAEEVPEPAAAFPPLPGRQEAAGLSHAFQGGDVEKILRRVEQITGKPVKRTYRRGREEAWQADQEAAAASEEEE